MAEKPAGEKTEKPTQRRITKAREEGRIAQSMELPAAFTLIALLVSFALAGSKLFQWFEDLIREGLSCNVNLFTSGNSFVAFFNEKLGAMLWITCPFLLAVIIGGVVASLIVGGMTFTMKPLKWKTEELSVIKGFQRLFSMSSIVKLLTAVAKIVLICVIVVFYLRKRIDLIAGFQWLSTGELVISIWKFLLGALVRICIALLVIAVVEAIYQKWKYNKGLKMTKQEVKEEHKSQEGSPEVKSKIRQIQMQMASRRMLRDVPEASVVIVNPTHYAVAIKYDPKRTAAPVVVAKGADNMCEKIKEIARAHGVPIIRRAPLARTLYSSVDVGKFIPENMFVAVAEVLAMIHRLRHNR